MARITVEDYIDKVSNRFELILIAAHRARTLVKGAVITVESDDDKPPVVALREIAEQTAQPAICVRASSIRCKRMSRSMNRKRSPHRRLRIPSARNSAVTIRPRILAST